MGLFDPPKSKKVAEMISIESPTAARRSTSWLRKMIKSGKMKVGDAVKYANLAANRAKAQLNRKNLSSKERKQMRGVYKVYRAFVDKFKRSGKSKSKPKQKKQKQKKKKKGKNAKRERKK